jgi:hypothetical protein
METDEHLPTAVRGAELGAGRVRAAREVVALVQCLAILPRRCQLAAFADPLADPVAA